VTDAAALAREWQNPDTDIVILPAGLANPETLAGIVSGRDNLKSLHIVSHGDAGALQLGGRTYAAEDLVRYRRAFHAIGAVLAPQGDVLLYGCNIGRDQQGIAFVAELSRLTGRDVAASSNQTGAAFMGGDWLLEQRQGVIETASLAAPHWQAVLSQNNTGTWTIGTNTASNGVTVGANTVTTTVTFSGHSTATTATATLTNETLNNISVFTPAVQNTASFGFQYAWDTAPEGATVLASTDGGTVVMTITFSQTVKDPILHLDRIGGSSNGLQNGATLTLQTAGVSLTRLSGTGHFAVTGSVISNSQVGVATGGGFTAESNTTVNLGTAAGSVRLNGTFSTVSFLLQPDVNALEGTGADVIEMKLTFDPVPVAQPDSFTTYYNTALSGNLYSDNGSGADTDFNGDILTITQINGAGFTVGTPIALSDGLLTITDATTGAFSFTPSSGFFGIQTFTYTVSDANGATSTATATITVVRTTVTLSKTSIGAVGAFTFTGNNGWSSQTITTATSGVAVTGSTQTLAAASTVTTITETIPSGYAVTAISCSGLGSGTATPNLATGSVILNAAATAAGNSISCSFTNTRLPTLQLRKISNGGIGTFNFSGDNGFGSEAITTVSQGVGVNGAVRTLTAASAATTITETIPATYFIASISCTGLGTGTATPNLSAGTVALDASATAPGNMIVCTFTNTVEQPALSVLKSANTAGPVNAGAVITYTFTVTNSGNRSVSSVQVSETFNGTGAAPVPSNEILLTDAVPTGDSSDATSNDGIWSSLGPGDVVRFTATYTVTQSDIDTLQ
jgi:hypothetical protein